MERKGKIVVVAVDFERNGAGFSGTKVFWLLARVFQYAFCEIRGFHPIGTETGQ